MTIDVGAHGQSIWDRPGDPAENTVHAKLSGYQEVPALSTGASGRFRANITGSSIAHELRYEGREGTASAAHIHFGQRGVNGGILAFLCGGGKPACPATSGTAAGTLVAADLMAVAGQGIDSGEFAEAVRAIRSGVAYADVHTAKIATGEIRGQTKR